MFLNCQLTEEHDSVALYSNPSEISSISYQRYLKCDFTVFIRMMWYFMVASKIKCGNIRIPYTLYPGKGTNKSI